MFKFFNKSKKKDFDEVVKRQLKKAMLVLESLCDYDAGEKHISIDRARMRLPNIRVSLGIGEDDALDQIASKRDIPGAEFISHEQTWG